MTERRTPSPHAKSLCDLTPGERAAIDNFERELRVALSETDNLTSFTPITEGEAEEIKERLRIDRASVYST